MPLINLIPSSTKDRFKRVKGAINRLKTQVLSVDALTTQTHVETFSEAGDEGAVILAVSACAKDAINTLHMAENLTGAEAARVWAMVQDLQLGNAIDNTVPDGTPVELFIAKSVNLAYEGGALPEAIRDIPAEFVVDSIGASGVVVTSDPVEE